ncbi:YIP1 family protein [candidate division WOR-3 bacterium]|nr:YIP1 family protein [candidate division WOR-3 bacterium]
MKKIIDLYFSPVETFKKLNEKPDWVIPVVLTLIVALIFTMIALPKVIIPEQSKRIMEMEQLTEEQREAASAGLGGIKPYITTPIAVTISFFFIVFVKSWLFFMIFMLFGSRTIFKKVLAIVSYSFLIGIPESIVKSSMMLIKKSTQVYTSIALLVPNLDFKSPFFKVLNRIDIFTIWNLILISLGFTIIYGMGKKKAFSIVFGLWVLWLLLVLAVGFILPKGLFFG